MVNLYSSLTVTSTEIELNRSSLQLSPVQAPKLSVSESRLSSASHPGTSKFGPLHGINLARKCCIACVFEVRLMAVYIPSWMPIRRLVADDVLNIHSYLAL